MHVWAIKDLNMIASSLPTVLLSLPYDPGNFMLSYILT